MSRIPTIFEPPLPWTLALALLAAPVGCVYAPSNGATFDDPGPQTRVTLSGFTRTPNMPVTIEVYEFGSGSPYSNGATWVPLRTVNSNTTPTYWNDPEPLYAWSATVEPLEENRNLRWPAGGLIRIRANSPAGILYTFDDQDCLAEHWNSSWKVMGRKCNSHDTGTLTWVDTSNRPEFPLGRSELWLSALETSDDESRRYYQAIDSGGVRSTFEGFKSHHDYDDAVLDGRVVSARYLNAGDLGFGRYMQCWRAEEGDQPRTACFVTNYSGTAGEFSNEDSAGALRDVVRDRNEFATVAMEYWDNYNDLAGTQEVMFFVYNAEGNQVFEADLDNEGKKSVPGICMSCHGGRPAEGSEDTDEPNNERPYIILGAQFLPFDIDTFEFNEEPQFQNQFSRAAQEDNFRKLNALVYRTNASPATTELIEGWYGGDPSYSAQAFNGDFVPAGWRNRKVVYNEVVKPYCRGCHIARPPGQRFQTWSEFRGHKGNIKARACEQHNMPHAEVTFDNFWDSSARAHLAGALRLNTPCN